MPLSIEKLESYLEGKGVSPERLKSECSREHLLTISCDVDNWETQAPHFGLDAGDVKAIKQENTDEEARRYAMLVKWKQINAFEATYRELVSTFLKTKRGDLARKVCDILAESIGRTPPPKTPPPESRHDTPSSKQPDFTQFGDPTLPLLMNLVGWKVKSKWHEIGSGLGVEETELTSIQQEEAGKPDSNQHCMRRVFTHWKSAVTSPYTWENLATVLQSPAVKEKAAMLELHKSLLGGTPPPQTTQSTTTPTSSASGAISTHQGPPPSKQPAQRLSSGISLDSKPLLSQLRVLRSSSGKVVKVKESVCAYWKDVATQLGFSSGLMKTIRKSNDGPEEQFDDMIERWLKGTEGTRQPISWKTLLIVLREIEHNVLASDLEKLLPEAQQPEN